MGEKKKPLRVRFTGVER